jgi:flagellar biosynthesis/type III secretory pathway protein FliH
MAGTLTINLPKAIQTVEIVRNTSGQLMTAQALQTEVIIEKNKELMQMCKCLDDVLNKFNEFQIKFMAEHKKGVTQLAIEIAKKILCKKIADGDYEIQAIIEEALRHSPSKKDILVQLNPKDFEEINRLQENGALEAFNGIKFVQNSEVGRADCILETPKGIVESFVAEHLQRIEKALTITD